MTIGQNIQMLRKQAGLSQEALGEALGVSRQAVSKWESNSALPELDTLIAIIRLFQVSLDRLLLIAPIEAQNATSEQAPSIDAEAVTGRLEELLKEYTAQSQEQRAHQLNRRRIAIGLAAGLLLSGGLYLNSYVSRLNQNLHRIENELSVMQDQVNNSIYGLTHQISDILEEQDNILADFSEQITGIDYDAGKVLYSLSASLKETMQGATGIFVLRYEDPNGAAQTLETEPLPGPVFTADVAIPYNHATDVTLQVTQPDGTLLIQQVTTLYDTHKDYFTLGGDAFMGYSSHATNDKNRLRLVLDGACQAYVPDLIEKFDLDLSIESVGADIYCNDTLLKHIDLIPDDGTHLDEYAVNAAPREQAIEIAVPENVMNGTNYIFPEEIEMTLDLQVGDRIKTIFYLTDNHGQRTYLIDGGDKGIEIIEKGSNLSFRSYRLSEEDIPK